MACGLANTELFFAHFPLFWINQCYLFHFISLLFLLKKSPWCSTERFKACIYLHSSCPPCAFLPLVMDRISRCNNLPLGWRESIKLPLMLLKVWIYWCWIPSSLNVSNYYLILLFERHCHCGYWNYFSCNNLKKSFVPISFHLPGFQKQICPSYLWFSVNHLSFC